MTSDNDEYHVPQTYFLPNAQTSSNQLRPAKSDVIIGDTGKPTGQNAEAVGFADPNVEKWGMPSYLIFFHTIASLKTLRI